MSTKSPRGKRQSNLPKRTCWICLSTDDDNSSSSWLEPCLCRGSTQWVHQICLEELVDSKQLGDSSIEVFCPQCDANYILDFPSFGIVASVMNLLDRIFHKCSMYMITGVRIGSLYWTAVTYGAFALIQLFGYEEGMRVMERADPFHLLLGLPAIPIALIFSRLIQWDIFVLNLWRQYSSKAPIIKHFVSPDDTTSSEERPATSSEPVSITRLICGALMLPVIASFTGKVMFGEDLCNLKRATWGGATYLVVKGVFKLYLRQKHYWRLRYRQILNHSEWEKDNKPSPDERND